MSEAEFIVENEWPLADEDNIPGRYLRRLNGNLVRAADYFPVCVHVSPLPSITSTMLFMKQCATAAKALFGCQSEGLLAYSVFR